MRNMILALVFLLNSCSSMSGEWGPWKMKDVSADKRVWRFCSATLDGEANHRKGICYESQECRTRKTIFGNERVECRGLLLFCAWGDVACLDKYEIFEKVILSK